MFRIKKGRNSPRTLYHGPFVLPNQNSPVWINKPSPTPCRGRQTSAPYSHWTSQPVNHTQHGYNHAYQSPVTPWPQPGLRPFLYRKEMGTPRSDEGCRPVFNFSFLDDSAVSHDRSAHQLGSLSICSPCGVLPATSKGRFGHLQNPMTKPSPLSKVSPGLINPGTYPMYSPLPGSNKVSTPRLNSFSSPKLSMLPLSRISPSSVTDVGDESSQSRFCEHHQLHRLQNPNEQRGDLSSSIGTATCRQNQPKQIFIPPLNQQPHAQNFAAVNNLPCFNPQHSNEQREALLLLAGNANCRQNHTKQVLTQSQNQQPYPQNFATVNNLPCFNPPNKTAFYHYNPTFPEGISATIPDTGYQPNPAVNPQNNTFMYQPYEHENLVYCLHKAGYNNIQQVFQGQTFPPINHYSKPQSSNNIENYGKRAQERNKVLPKYPSLQTIPHHANLGPSQRNYTQKGYVNGLQTIQEYILQNREGSTSTKQSSFCSSLLSTDQSQNTNNSEQNKCIRRTNCEDKNCACGKLQQKPPANEHMSKMPNAVQDNYSEIEHFYQDPIYPRSENSMADPKYRLEVPPSSQENGIAAPDGERRTRYTRNVDSHITAHYYKEPGYARDSSYQHPEDFQRGHHGKRVEQPAWRNRQTREPIRSNAYHRDENRDFEAVECNRGRQEQNRRDIPKKHSEWQGSERIERRTGSKHNAKFQREDQRSPEFRGSESRRFPRDDVVSSRNCSFRGANQEERRDPKWVKGQGPRGYDAADFSVQNRPNGRDKPSSFTGFSKTTRGGNSRFDRNGEQASTSDSVGIGDDERVETVPKQAAGDYFGETNSATATILKKFAQEVKKFHTKGNSPIQTLHDCANCSSLPIQIRCSIDPSFKNNKEDGFTAVLSINGTCLARQTGKSKRLLKQKVYEIAFSQLLKTTTSQEAVPSSNACMKSEHAEEVFRDSNVGSRDVVQGENAQGGSGGILTSSKDPEETKQGNEFGDENIAETQARYKNVDFESKKAGLDPVTLSHLDHLVRDLKSFRGGESSKVSQIWTVDKHCVKNRLKLIAIYKGEHQPNEHMAISCDLYLCERFLAQGKGTNRKFAQTNAYKRACEILRNMSSAKDVQILPHLDLRELKLPDVIDIVHKGYQVVEESNLCRMNRTKQPPLEHRNLSSLILLEHEDWSRDRKKHAHCILAQSATQCGCLLEWRSEPCGRGFRCTMTLQGEQIASCVTHLRKDAVRVASIVALFTFYETQPVVQGFHIDYPSIWTTRAQLMEKAKAAAKNVCIARKTESSQPDLCQNVPKEEEYKLQLEDGVAPAIDLMVEEFSKRKTLELIVCAPDWRTEEKRCLRGAATGSGLRVVTENFQEEQILVISHKHSLIEIYTILLDQPGKAQGRYKILRDEEKPCYMDVAAEIAANESILGDVAPNVQRPTLTRRFNIHRDQYVKSISKSPMDSRRFQDRALGLDSKASGFKPTESDIPECSPGESISGHPSRGKKILPDAEITNQQPVTTETANAEVKSQKYTSKTEEQNSPGSSNRSDVFVSANNTMDNGIIDARVRGDDMNNASATSSPLGGHCPDMVEISPDDKAKSPDDFSISRPRITSTPSSHKVEGSKTKSKAKSNHSRSLDADANPNRELSFATPKIVQDATQNSVNSKLPENLPTEKEAVEKQSPSDSMPSSLSPTPSDPSSARLNDPLTNSRDSQSNEPQSKEKSCQCGKSLQEQQDLITSQSQHLLNTDQKLPSTNESSPKRPRRPKMDGSIDLEACLRSPEQRAVCIIEQQSSKCVPFSSEFETYSETRFD